MVESASNNFDIGKNAKGKSALYFYRIVHVLSIHCIINNTEFTDQDNCRELRELRVVDGIYHGTYRSWYTNKYRGTK